MRQNIPTITRLGVIIIWVTLAATAVMILIELWLGVIGKTYLIISLIMYGLMCFIPYKIGKGSDNARYFYLILTVILILSNLMGAGKIPIPEYSLSIALIPVELFAIYCLFQDKSSKWFMELQANK